MNLTPATLEAVRPLLAEARQHYTHILALEEAVRRDFEALYVESWHFGRVLSSVKHEVGHGRWLFFLGANWPELGVRSAQRCMAFFDDNPADGSNTTVPSYFDIDSIRKLLGCYLPAKLRPELEDDQRLAPVATFDSGTNKFSAYFHRVKEGHIKPAPLDKVAPQVRLIIDGLREIYGREPIDALLA